MKLLQYWRDERLGPATELALPAGKVRVHETGSGPPLLFVHGYLVNANLWRKLVPLLASDFRCITPDWPLGSHVTPMPRGADLSPQGVGRLITATIETMGLEDVTLLGNDSGGAYSQIAVAQNPDRVARLVLNSCETPWCTWPPTPGGFPALKRAARHHSTHRLLYQPLRNPRTWRLPNTYGWLAQRPIDEHVMASYVEPTIRRSEIRRDGRAAIGSVDERHVIAAATTIEASYDRPILCLWSDNDRVFPPEAGERYARRLGADFVAIDDAYTYTAEDQPDAMAAALRTWLSGLREPDPDSVTIRTASVPEDRQGGQARGDC